MYVGQVISPSSLPRRAIDDDGVILPCKARGVPTPWHEGSSKHDSETVADRCSDATPRWSEDDQRIVIWNNDIVRIYRHNFYIRSGHYIDLSVGSQVTVAHRLLAVPL